MRYIFTLQLFALLILSACSSHHDEGEEHHDEEHHHSGITFSPEKATRFGIEFETVEPGNFHDVVKTSGVIESSGSDLYSVTAKKSGIITLAPGINQGAAVKSGERIASISAEGVEGGDASKATASNFQAAKAEYERLKPLYEEKLVTASVFREAERAYREAEALAGKGGKGGSAVLTSPTEGSLQNLYVKSGEYVEVGTPVATVSKNSSLLLRADLPAREAKHLAELETANFIPEGSRETVRLTDVEGKKVSGSSAPVNNGYIPVYFSFKGNPLSYPGGYAEVYLICGERRNVISVPREALVEIQGNKYIYVAEDDHDYEKRLVKTGASDGERVEILEGLQEGDKIVSKGASVIRMAEVSSVAPPAHSHSH